jgi:protein gp37
LLGPIQNVYLSNIDWIIVGGESGLNARPMEISWALTIKNMCQKNKIPFFFKQLGGRNGKRGGMEALLEGRIWYQYPKNQADLIY